MIDLPPKDLILFHRNYPINYIVNLSTATVTLHFLFRAFLSTLKHTQTFSRFHDKDMAQYIRRLLASSAAGQLAEFELAQLANLCPESAEEAKTLIPR